MGGKRKPASRTVATLEREQRIQDVERCLLAGITSLNDLAVRHGVTTQCITNDIKAIRGRWVSRSGNHDEQRAYRIRQVEQVYANCCAAYERSRQDKITTREEPCDNLKCDNGTVQQDGVTRPCPRCDGKEKIIVTTRQASGGPGDPKWMTVALAAILDAARLEGLVITSQQALVALKETAERELTPGGAIIERVETLYLQAPEEDVLKVMAMLDRFKNKALEEESPKVIEVQAEHRADGSAAA